MAFRYNNIVLAIAVMGLSACATPYPERMDIQKQSQQVVVEPVAPVAPKGMTNEEIFSNPNVIVFPVTGDLSQSKQAFAKYRGVIENTTAGGYTVFDPSVTVYALEGQGMKPAYLPEYSVPRYAQNYMPQNVPTQIRSAALPPLPLGYQEDSYVPETLSMQPRVPQNRVSAPFENEYGALPVRNVEPRRSRPVLTGYE